MEPRAALGVVRSLTALVGTSDFRLQILAKSLQSSMIHSVAPTTNKPRHPPIPPRLLITKSSPFRTYREPAIPDTARPFPHDPSHESSRREVKSLANRCVLHAPAAEDPNKNNYYVLFPDSFFSSPFSPFSPFSSASSFLLPFSGTVHGSSSLNWSLFVTRSCRATTQRNSEDI